MINNPNNIANLSLLNNGSDGMCAARLAGTLTCAWPFGNIEAQRKQRIM